MGEIPVDLTASLQHGMVRYLSLVSLQTVVRVLVIIIIVIVVAATKAEVAHAFGHKVIEKVQRTTTAGLAALLLG